MDQETIRRLTEEIAHHLNYPWSFLVQVLLTVGAFGLGAFFGGYLRTRGRNLATTADFERLQSQLSANTKLVETIRAEVNQRDWATREWINLRRARLEELVSILAECHHYLDRKKSAADGKIQDKPGPDPYIRLDAVATLYFPELKEEVLSYSRAHSNLKVAISQYAFDLARAGTDARKTVVAAFGEKQMPLHLEILKARTQVNEAARKLMSKLMSVAP